MTRVWVTRDEPVGGPMAGALEAVGLTPVSEPVLETRVVGDAAEEISTLGPDDWLVLTSPRAVRGVAIGPARRPRWGARPRRRSPARWGCVWSW